MSRSSTFFSEHPSDSEQLKKLREELFLKFSQNNILPLVAHLRIQDVLGMIEHDGVNFAPRKNAPSEQFGLLQQYCATLDSKLTTDDSDTLKKYLLLDCKIEETSALDLKFHRKALSQEDYNKELGTIRTTLSDAFPDSDTSIKKNESMFSSLIRFFKQLISTIFDSPKNFVEDDKTAQENEPDSVSYTSFANMSH